MATLTLKVLVSGSNATKTMQFDPSMIVYDACRVIRDKLPDAGSTNANEYGLFLADDDPKKGVWLESGRTLEYYLLRNGDLLEYRKKQRMLRVRMLDGAVKTLQLDDSHTVAQLMITICSKIGITNHEEYSLVRDLPDSEKEKTLTLRRDKSIAKDQRKMDEMRRKLHTDDELNWMDHTKTLREQGVEPSDTLLLRRKYFFSDQNVDARDPVQLNLLYVQTRDAILKGGHPINQEEAVQFAGLQCQIQFGDHNENKHRNGFLDLKEFLPKEYVRVKGIEKKVFVEHKKLQGLSEVDSKVKYNNLARSLKTYGIAFFLVKEKLKGKNKLVPRLLGVTKDSVVRVDEKTKEILKTWPLTTVRRWAASPNSFTLDFGDYSDSYYSVQTMEGEQISQLISGYIDIILKKKAAKDHLGVDGEEESTMYEDSVAPAKATIIQHQVSKIGHANTGSVALGAVLRSGENLDGNRVDVGSMQKPLVSQVTNHGAMNGSTLHHTGAPQMATFSKAQRALLGTINEGLSAVDESKQSLENRAELPPLGSDAASSKWKETTKDLSRQKVGSQLSAMNAATAHMVTLTSAGPDETDFTAVGSAVQTISANIGEFSKDVRMLAALEDAPSDGDRLLGAARRLAGAFSGLLSAAQPGSHEPRQALLNAATRIGEAGQEVMTFVEPPTPGDDSYKDTLLALAKAVANATATLVLKAKGVASKCDNQSDQNVVIGAATQCALSTSQLVACTKVVAPTLNSSSECQGQLVEAAKQVAKSVDDIVETAQNVCDNDPALKDLGEAATSVTLALDDMMQHVRRTNCRNFQESDEVEQILSTTDRLYNSVGDTPEMVKQARQLALATSQLVNALKMEAESHQDADQQRKLLAAAKLLADATAKMVEAAKGCASTPHDPGNQEMLMRAAEDLKRVTHQAAHAKSRNNAFSILQDAVKRAASASTQLINASGAAGKSNRNQSSQQQMMMACKLVAEDSIPRAIQSLRSTVKNPESPNSTVMLIAAAHDMLQPCSKMLSCAKASVPTVSDQAAALSLSNASSTLASAIVDLRQAVTKTRESFTPHDLDAALLRVRDLELELDLVKRSAREKGLAPLPGETAEACTLKLGATSKVVGSTLARLLTAAAQGNESYTGQAAKETAEVLSTLIDSIRGVAATSSDDHRLQESIIDHGGDVLEKSGRLIEEAGLATANPSDPENQARLAQVAKGVSQALNSCLGCLPGMREVDEAARHISTVSIQLSEPQTTQPPGEVVIAEVQTRLTSNAADLNSATGDVVSAAASASSQQVAKASDRFSKAYEQLVSSGLEAARSVPQDLESQERIVTRLRGVSSVSGRLLVAAKSMLVDPHAPNAKNQLTQAARAVTESINNLINVCTDSTPGQKECENALRQIKMMKPLLQEPNEPIMDSNYYECLDGVIDKSKNLADAMTGMSSQAQQRDFTSFCGSVAEFASSVCAMIEYIAQAAYLIGTADPASEPGRPGLVDQSQFARSQQAIQSACQSLANPANDQQQILSAAASIAKNTSSLCNACRVASSKTNNPVAKKHFVQAAKDVANSTANLVRAIKVLDNDFSEENLLRCSESSKPLLQAVESLSAFASSAEFAGVPAKISPQARKAQEPISKAGFDIIDGACDMLTSARQLTFHPKDPTCFQEYSGRSHFLSESIKVMVTSIREGAPGQSECDVAMQNIGKILQRFDSISLATGDHQRPCLPTQSLNSIQSTQELILNSSRQLYEHVDPISNAAKSEPENLGHLVSSASTYLEPLTEGMISYSSSVFNTRLRETLLDQTRTVVEAMMSLLNIVKESAGSHRSPASHQVIDELSESTKESLTELIGSVQNVSSSSGVVSGLVEDITRSMTTLNDQDFAVRRRSYVDHQTDIVRVSKQMARNVQEMMTQSVTNTTELCNTATHITRDFCSLALDAREAADASADFQVSGRIKSVILQLGNSCVVLIQDGGAVRSRPADQPLKQQLHEHAKKVLESISQLLWTFHSMARGTQACINASSTVSGIIGDLDTTIMFATTGTLNSDNKESFSDHRENILKTAKALVEDTKTLVSGAASDQEMLAGAAQNAVLTITKLADCVKHGAASLGSEQPEAQVLLINAVKDVASALADLMNATKNASGKLPCESSMTVLKDSAKVMVTNVTSLLKTVKTVEDESARGLQALESSIEVIGQEMKTYTSTEHVEQKVAPDDIIRLTRPVTTATAKAVAAGNSCQQGDIIAAANLGRKAISDLLKACKGGATEVDDPSIKKKLLEAGHACGMAFRQLLIQINEALQKPNPQSRQMISSASKQVAVAINDIVQSAEAVRAQDWMESMLEGTTESELLNATNSIEAALLRLNNVQSQVRRQDSTSKGDSDILDAARSIATATCSLIRAASMAQRELIAQGKLGDVSGASDLEDDSSQWSQGLISAARLVAAATQNLCNAANALSQGCGSEEKLISSAKQVASSTAQLLVACKVKADPTSVAMRRLQSAGNAVKRATEALVQEAQRFKIQPTVDSKVTVDERMVSGMAQLIMAQEDILIKEKELETARKRLEIMRRAKYRDREWDSTDSGTDF